MFVTATQVTVWTNISASAATITASGLIEIAEERAELMTNNQFLTDLYLQTGMTFNATDRTVIASGGNFANEGFIAGDKIYIYNSYRNDGYYEIDSVSTSTLTLVTGSTVTDELSGRSIMISVVNYPESLKYTISQMVKYDTDDRIASGANLKSKKLGPWSETYKEDTSDFGQTWGYPQEIVNALANYTVLRVM